MNVEKKDTECLVCRRRVFYDSATTNHPESPEFMTCSGWSAIYLTASNEARVIHCCSNACLEKFFEKGG